MKTLQLSNQRVMGSSRAWSYLKSLRVFHTFCIFLGLVHSGTSLTINLGNIGPQNQNREIVIEGNATYISSQGLQFIPDVTGINQTSTVGRATYIRPLHLWDNASGELASFDANFKFVIESTGVEAYGDGLAFFLAGNDSIIMGGGSLGLPINYTTLNATNQFVAVEFDTFYNDWDPIDWTNSSIGDHVGININSIKSVQTKKWYSDIIKGRVNEAWISYNSTSKTLGVVFTGFVNNSIIKQYGLQSTVDLRNELPEWVIFGFSASTGVAVEKNTIQSWYFNSSDLKIDKMPNSGKKQKMRGNNKLLVVVAVSFGLCVLVAGIASSFIKNMSETKEEELGIGVRMDNIFKMGCGPKKFRYKGLARATNGFAEDKKLGQGGFGGVYRGFLMEMSSYVAVKKVSRSSTQGMKEYASEVMIISRLRHRNLVQLIGWCHEKRKLLLVYEFLENGSLDSHLFKERSLLTWKQRYKIAQGLASAVLYLHEEWEQCVLHRDIKSSNVMLDSNFNTKLGDFGLAKLVDHEKESETTCLAGTFGYLAPERWLTGKASKGSDVYSFGVVALEIACGRRSIEFQDSECHARLVDMVWDLYGRGKLDDAADPKLAADYNEEQMERLMVVGLWCAHPDLNLRPSIKQAIQVLNFEAPPPNLPTTVPVPTYVTSSSDLSAFWLTFSHGHSGSKDGRTWSSSSTCNVIQTNLSNSS